MLRNKRTKTFGLALATAILMGTVIVSSYDTLQATANVQTPAEAAKSELQTKMWSAIDSYKSLKGTYVAFSERSGLTATVAFQVRQGNKPASFTKSTFSDGHVGESRFNGTHVIEKLDGKVMMASKVIPVVNNKRPEFKYGMRGKEREVNLRRDPAFAGAGAVTFPQELSLSFLEDYSKWTIIGESTHLDRTVTVVTGELSGYLKEKHRADHFKLWVDKELGILLKLEEYNAAGTAVEGHEVTSLKVNGELDEKLMTLTQQEMEMKK